MLDRNLASETSAMTDKNTPLVPEEGWHCLHLFYRIDFGQWQLLSRDEQNAAKTELCRRWCRKCARRNRRNCSLSAS